MNRLEAKKIVTAYNRFLRTKIADKTWRKELSDGLEQVIETQIQGASSHATYPLTGRAHPSQYVKIPSTHGDIRFTESEMIFGEDQSYKIEITTSIVTSYLLRNEGRAIMESELRKATGTKNPISTVTGMRYAFDRKVSSHELAYYTGNVKEKWAMISKA